MQALTDWLRRLWPEPPTADARERLRVVVGAAMGILMAGLVMRWSGVDPWLIAPMGATAVLVFAVPGSPMAQPWAVVAGNSLSALVGLACVHLFRRPELAAAVAVGSAIGLMMLLRCLHPPGGACALLCALGAGANGWGWSFLLMPLAPNVLALAASGWLYNRLTGHPWPHHPAALPALPPDTWAGTYDIADLDAVLADWDEVLDIDREDLDALFRALERRVQARWESARQ